MNPYKAYTASLIAFTFFPFFTFAQYNESTQPAIRPVSGAVSTMQKKEQPRPTAAQPPVQPPAYAPKTNSTTLPPKSQRMEKCEWNAADESFACILSDGTSVKYYARIKPPRARQTPWNEDVYTLINNARAALLYPRLFVWDATKDRLVYDAASKPKQGQPMKNPTLPLPEQKLAPAETPLAQLPQGQFKPILGSDLLEMGIQLEILNRLRTPINEKKITWAGGAPFSNPFLITPAGYVDMPFSDPSKKYDFQAANKTRSMPTLMIRDKKGRPQPVLTLAPPTPFKNTNPDLDPESPIVLPLPSGGPSAGNLPDGSRQGIGISQEITNALANGKISWSIFIQLYEKYFGGPYGPKGSVELVTDKEGNQVGFHFMAPKTPESGRFEGDFQYIFSDRKNAAGQPGTDGVFDTVDLYIMTPSGGMTRIFIIPPTLSEKAKKDIAEGAKVEINPVNGNILIYPKVK